MLPHLLAIGLTVVQPDQTGLDGRWINPGGSVIISIAPCNDTSCGRVEWASEKAKADARKGGTDPLIGAELLKDIVPYGQGRWRARLFVPDLNTTSKAELRLLGRDLLKVRGCAVGRIICKSQVWTRLAVESVTPGLQWEPQ
jgi:uncharacterized protein (DUF2147 family)